jgi:hypothetical protein
MAHEMADAPLPRVIEGSAVEVSAPRRGVARRDVNPSAPYGKPRG